MRTTESEKMFNNDRGIDILINDATDRLRTIEIDTPEYESNLKYLERLCALREPKKAIDPNTMLLVGGNILGVLIIVTYEHAHVITSKSFGLLFKK